MGGGRCALFTEFNVVPFYKNNETSITRLGRTVVMRMDPENGPSVFLSTVPEMNSFLPDQITDKNIKINNVKAKIV